jgi:hypothetical protein
MTDAVKRHSISSEPAPRIVDAAVAKAGEIGVGENVAILDNGAISRHSAECMRLQSRIKSH